jgi:flavorubredoxin
MPSKNGKWRSPLQAAAQADHTSLNPHRMRRVLPAMAALLDDIQGLNPPGKVGFAFGSQGWAGGAIKLMEETLEAIKANKIIEGIKATDKPTPAELAACRVAGKQLAEAVKAG